MPMPLTPDAFSKLIDDDVQWLKANAPDSLERQHIIQVLLQRASDYAQHASQAGVRDAERYRDLRTLLYGQDVVIDEATLIFKVTGQCPTTEEFDAGVDSAIAAAKGEAQ